MVKLAFVIDCDRCIGCKGCQVACKMENELPLGHDRMKVCTIGPHGQFPKLQMYFLPAMCQMCNAPACAAACPTGACVKDEATGVVKIDISLCVGCGKCERKCPYGCVKISREVGKADKCEGCLSAFEKGEKPACVRNCSGSAIKFGDINDSQSEVSLLLASVEPSRVYSLRDEGNSPAVKYILRRDEWKDILPSECVEHVAFKRGGKI